MQPASSMLLRACRSEPVDFTPVWFMRQAGRALPEYRELRSEGTILDAIRTPDLATEITLQPVRRYGVDAAILFSDIVVPIAAIGVGVEIVSGRGPVIDAPFRHASDLKRLRPLEPELDTPFVIEAVKNLVAELDVPLIGFAGAPFTVASYLIEGGSSRDFAHTKVLMHSEPAVWHSLMEKLADLAIASLRSQIEAGASVVQLFDSWAGALTREEYRHFVMPATSRVFAAVEDLHVPRIHFGVGTGELLDLMADTGADVVGVDWRVPLDRARTRVGPRPALQGNLDPAICLAGFDLAAVHARAVLDRAGSAAGHIFNLGHGVLPTTDPDVLTRLVAFVHEESTRRRADSEGSVR